MRIVIQNRSANARLPQCRLREQAVHRVPPILQEFRGVICARPRPLQAPLISGRAGYLRYCGLRRILHSLKNLGQFNSSFTISDDGFELAQLSATKGGVVTS
jgi:hypothetical protein